MKRILSLVLVSTLLLASCGGPGGAASPQKSANPGVEGSGERMKLNYVVSEAVYPEFPQQPQFPEEGSDEAWKEYNDAYDKYTDALLAIRGDNSNLTEAEWNAINTFAAKSAPLAIAGHEGENVVYSPLSLWSALAMLAQCAGGESRQQVLDALEVDHVDSLQETVSHVWQTLYTDDGVSALLLANSIWLNSNLQGNYVQDTLDILAQKYFVGTYAVPMGMEEANQAVTGWVNQQTNGLIGGDTPVVQTMPDTLALLVSSLYYRAAWQEEFNAARTEEDIFTNAAGEEVRVDFMHQTQDANFQRREDYQAARLATYLGEMVFILPSEGVTPESLLQNPDFLSQLDFYGDAVTWGEVQWSVPKFDVNSDLSLMDTLNSLGVTDLLDYDRADLSALTDLDAYLSEAKQLARVKVDEEGVEAAAVTILEIDTCCALPPVEPEVCVMDLDRPFLFVIRTQDVPLFIGIVNQV